MRVEAESVFAPTIARNGFCRLRWRAKIRARRPLCPRSRWFYRNSCG